MRYDPIAHRVALSEFLEANRNSLGSLNGWAKQASVSEAALRAFLKGDTRALSMETYAALASAAAVPVSALLPGPANLTDELSAEILSCDAKIAKLAEEESSLVQAIEVARNQISADTSRLQLLQEERATWVRRRLLLQHTTSR